MTNVEIILAALGSTEQKVIVRERDTICIQESTFTGEDREKLKEKLLTIIIGIQV